MIQQEIEAAYSSVMTSYNRGLVPRSEDIKLLLDLTKLHLQVMKSGVPKKKEYANGDIFPTDDRDYDPAYVEGYNACHDDFTTYLTQKLGGLEEVIRESSLCHLCLSNVSEGEKEIKELVEIIRKHLEVER